MINPRVVRKHIFAMRMCFKLGRPAFVRLSNRLLLSSKFCTIFMQLSLMIISSRLPRSSDEGERESKLMSLNESSICGKLFDSRISFEKSKHSTTHSPFPLSNPLIQNCESTW